MQVHAVNDILGWEDKLRNAELEVLKIRADVIEKSVNSVKMLHELINAKEGCFIFLV